MSEEPVPIHPVAPRLKDGAKVPHVGPDLSAYQSAHAETLGHESDAWWRKASSHIHFFLLCLAY
jgi:acetyl-CoA synthetase